MHRLGHLKVTHVKFLSAGFKNSSNSLLNRTYRTDYFFENWNKYRNLKFGKFWRSKKSFYMKNPFNISEKYTHWKIVDYGNNFYYLHFLKSLFFGCTSKKISFEYLCPLLAKGPFLYYVRVFLAFSRPPIHLCKE